MAADEQSRVVPDDERARQILDQLKSVHAFDLAYETMVGLVNFGSQKMGLLEETREVRDLDDARLSIELVRAILEVVEREQGAERTRGLHDALAQMQLAYAHAVQLANAERAAAREGEGGQPGGGDAAPEAPADAEPAPEVPAREEPAGEAAADPGEPARGPRAEGKPGATKKPAAQKKPPAKKKPAKPAAKRKPAAGEEPTGEG